MPSATTGRDMCVMAQEWHYQSESLVLTELVAPLSVIQSACTTIGSSDLTLISLLNFSKTEERARATEATRR